MGIAVADTRSIPWSTEDSIFPQAKVFLGETVVGLLPEPSAPMLYMNFLTIPKGLEGYQTHTTTTTIWEYISQCIKPNNLFEFV